MTKGRTRGRRAGIAATALVAGAGACLLGWPAAAVAIEPGEPVLAALSRVRPMLPIADVTPVAPPGEPVPLIDPADASGLPAAPAPVEPAAGGALGGGTPATGPERLVDPVLSIDPTLEGPAADRAVRRGLAGLLGTASVQPRSSDLWPVEAPVLEGLVGPQGARLEAPREPADPLWRARAKPPVELGEPARTGGPVNTITPTLAKASGGARPFR